MIQSSLALVVQLETDQPILLRQLLRMFGACCCEYPSLRAGLVPWESYLIPSSLDNAGEQCALIQGSALGTSTPNNPPKKKQTGPSTARGSQVKRGCQCTVQLFSAQVPCATGCARATTASGVNGRQQQSGGDDHVCGCGLPATAAFRARR